MWTRIMLTHAKSKTYKKPKHYVKSKLKQVILPIMRPSFYPNFQNPNETTEEITTSL